MQTFKYSSDVRQRGFFIAKRVRGDGKTDDRRDELRLPVLKRRLERKDVGRRGCVGIDNGTVVRTEGLDRADTSIDRALVVDAADEAKGVAAVVVFTDCVRDMDVPVLNEEVRGRHVPLEHSSETVVVTVTVRELDVS